MPMFTCVSIVTEPLHMNPTVVKKTRGGYYDGEGAFYLIPTPWYWVRDGIWSQSKEAAAKMGDDEAAILLAALKAGNPDVVFNVSLS